MIVLLSKNWKTMEKQRTQTCTLLKQYNSILEKQETIQYTHLHHTC